MMKKNTENAINLKDFDEVYKEYGHLIETTVNRRFSSPSFLQLHGLVRDDLFQHGRLGMQKAIDTYEEGKSSFRTHLINNIYYNINTECRRESLSKTSDWKTFEVINKVSLDAASSGDDPDISFHDVVEDDMSSEEIFDNARMNELLVELSKNFPVDTMELFYMRIKGMTNKEIAEVQGISHQSVSRKLRNLKEKVRSVIYSHAS